jgi:hypothetical protein
MDSPSTSDPFILFDEGGIQAQSSLLGHQIRIDLPWGALVRFWRSLWETSDPEKHPVVRVGARRPRVHYGEAPS